MMHIAIKVKAKRPDQLPRALRLIFNSKFKNKNFNSEKYFKLQIIKKFCYICSQEPMSKFSAVNLPKFKDHEEPCKECKT